MHIQYKESLLPNGWTLFLLIVAGILWLASSLISSGSYFGKTVSLIGSRIDLAETGSRTIEIRPDKWQAFRIPRKNFQCQIEIDSGSFQIQFSGSRKIFEKDSAGQWRDENGDLIVSPTGVAKPNFKIRSVGGPAKITISVW